MAGVSYFSKEIKDKSDLVIVSPDVGAIKRAEGFQKLFNKLEGENEKIGFAVMHKERIEANKVEKTTLLGSVQGKNCLIVDDMIDTAGTLCEAAKQLKANGAKDIYAFATHGLFSGPAGERIKNSVIKKVVTTDSVKVTKEFRETVGDKYGEVSLDLLVAEIIRRIDGKESFEELITSPNYK